MVWYFWASFVGVQLGLYPLLATSPCFMHGCCMMMNNSLGICRYEWALKGFSSHIKYCQMGLCHHLIIRLFTCERRRNDQIDGTSANIQYTWYITTHFTLVSQMFPCFPQRSAGLPSDWSLRGPITSATESKRVGRKGHPPVSEGKTALYFPRGFPWFKWFIIQAKTGDPNTVVD